MDCWPVVTITACNRAAAVQRGLPVAAPPVRIALETVATASRELATARVELSGLEEERADVPALVPALRRRTSTASIRWVGATRHDAGPMAWPAFD
jgi:hypothetical protein